MTWREKALCRILLLIAKIVAGNDMSMQHEIRNLSNHISQGPPETLTEVV